MPGGLRFCFLTTFYPPFNFGGDGIAVQRLARALVARGSEVTVVHDRDAFRLLRRGPDPPSTPEPAGVHVVGLESRFARLGLLLTHQLGRPVIHALRLHRLLRDGRFDVLVLNNISLIGGPGLLSYAADTPKIYLAHEHWLVCETHTLWRHNRELCTGRQCVRCALTYRRPPQLWRRTGLLRRKLQHVDTFVAMSEFSRRKHQEFGFDREMTILPQFLPPADPVSGDDRHSPHHRAYFLFVGRLERLKGVDDVIATFEQYEDADLVIAGEGSHAEVLQRLAGTNQRIIFLGRVDGPALNRLYRHAIALIVPSLCYETFGMITLEAFQQGTPVIARRIGPFPEIVDGASAGETFETHDDLIRAMRRVQSDPDYRAALSGAALQAYEAHYSDRVVVPRFLDLVRGVIDARSRARQAGART